MDAASQSASGTSEALADQAMALLSELVDRCSGTVEATEAEFRDCLMAEAAKAEAECGLQTYLITREGCWGCAEAKEDLKPFLDGKTVLEIDSATPAAQNLLEQAGMTTVPALLLADCRGGVVANFAIVPEED